MNFASEAKMLVGLSLSADGLVSAERVKAVCEYVAENPEYSDKLKLLKAYLKYIKPLVNRRSAVIETSGEISKDSLDSLLARIEKAAGGRVEVHTKINKALLGGIRVKIGDDIYERSVSDELASLGKF